MTIKLTNSNPDFYYYKGNSESKQPALYYSTLDEPLRITTDTGHSEDAVKLKTDVSVIIQALKVEFADSIVIPGKNIEIYCRKLSVPKKT